MNKPPVHASLFSGIGGFDLAAEWLGFRNAFHCEINPFCTRILKYHFPDAIYLVILRNAYLLFLNGEMIVFFMVFLLYPFIQKYQKYRISLPPCRIYSKSCRIV